MTAFLQPHTPLGRQAPGGCVPVAAAVSGSSTNARTATIVSAKLATSPTPALRTKPDHCVLFVESSANAAEKLQQF